MMATLERWLTAFLAWLTGLFQVAPADINKDKRGNLPPPEGGPSA